LKVQKFEERNKEIDGILESKMNELDKVNYKVLELSNLRLLAIE
jgi:hypothetical protein